MVFPEDQFFWELGLLGLSLNFAFWKNPFLTSLVKIPIIFQKQDSGCDVVLSPSPQKNAGAFRLPKGIHLELSTTNPVKLEVSNVQNEIGYEARRQTPRNINPVMRSNSVSSESHVIISFRICSTISTGGGFCPSSVRTEKSHLLYELSSGASELVNLAFWFLLKCQKLTLRSVES